MNDRMLPPGLRKRVDRIAAAEGLDARAIVLTAVRELVKAFPGPAPRRRARAEVRHARRPRKSRGMAHTSAAPAPCEDTMTCVRCDHDDAAHELVGARWGRCLEPRCGCEEFYA